MNMGYNGRAAVSAEATSGFLDLVLKVPCSNHDVVSGEPCGSYPKAV
jgi:hypothetical protein